MKSRKEIHDSFVGRFHFGDRMAPWTNQQLNEIEAELDTKLPAAYREFMTRHGVIYTPQILEQIVDANLDHPDVQDFFKPHEVIDDTRAYWSGGMPEDVIGIASDCMGNMIGFRRQPGFS